MPMSSSILRTAIGGAFFTLVASQSLVHILTQVQAKTAPYRPQAEYAAPMRAYAPVAPATPNAAIGEAIIPADRLGQYSANVEIEGQRVRMLVDTGASTVVLSYEDAAAIGCLPAPADFKYPAQTANGVAHMAWVKLREARLGQVALRDVDAYVAERGALGASLLGMTFLSRLSHIEAGNGKLVLRQ
ncbi:TIGR02281 family clan AA aspartic protease [Methylosinus sporium]|uniref:TIGR02281 family clan AA aspartic protease n=2 Tax=Methylocystaceae TaxID=31993 RepID=A0A549SDM5_METSR|nr:TIGR02281 family clan AA aspartic protease [Methylosinus sp. KRF6]TRL26572.1 TIGR02281 family clan AA aspartic protease [Methylosinus sporium]